MIELKTAIANTVPVKHDTRPGLCLDMGSVSDSRISPAWSMGAWRLQFVRLPPGESLHPDHSEGEVYVKVIQGRLESPERRAYPRPHELVTTRVLTESVTAGDAGALVSVFTADPNVHRSLSSMEQLVMKGPLSETLVWETFESRFSRFTPFFNGADAHLVPGFHLLAANGEEIAYVYFWTAGKGVDLSTHNHGNTPSPHSPAFAEVHQVLNNGTGKGGMYLTAEPGAPTRTRLTMQRGEEHGPFFVVIPNPSDPATGRPKLRENGAVDYPWHGWEAGSDSLPGQRYDLVTAYEITAPYAVI